MIKDVASILRVCGLGNYLHIGDGNKTLVFEMIKRSIDAFGIDHSEEIVANNLQRAPGRFFQGSLSHYPFKAEAFDTVIIGSELFSLDSEYIPAILQALWQMTKRNLVLYFPPGVISRIPRGQETNRLFWEKSAINAGFRRHPREMLVNTYPELENEYIGPYTFFEKISTAAQESFPMSWLLENRDLHMDMLREAGRRSDGHVSRYVLAAERIQAGDVVVDAACGLGYGTAVLAACSAGARFVGVDIDPDSVAYAEINYAAMNPALSYQASDATKLSFLADHSVDVFVSFETIEHLIDYDIFLKEVKRVLKPNGRFIGSVPNLWCDETGKDPNPFHFHVFDWNKLKSAIGKHFIVDACWGQTAGGGYKMHHGKREMSRQPLNPTADIEAEWLIFSACVDPRHAKLPFTNLFSKGEELPALVDFEKYYDNAWLYHTIVQQGIRLLDADVLNDFCISLLTEVRSGSADHGAALCVLAYRLLESADVTSGAVMTIINHINIFDKAFDSNNPHSYRWSLSLHFVAARLLLAIGNREDALTTFLTCAEMDALQFSPLLATKTISSRMFAGLIYVGSNKLDEAREQFKLGVKEAQRVLQGDWANIIDTFEQPLSFGLPETGEVINMASQCAEALNALHRQTSVPGYFWDRINIKFFGLVEWNRGIERENAYLRQQLRESVTS